MLRTGLRMGLRTWLRTWQWLGWRSGRTWSSKGCRWLRMGLRMDPQLGLRTGLRRSQTPVTGSAQGMGLAQVMDLAQGMGLAQVTDLAPVASESTRGT